MRLPELFVAHYASVWRLLRRLGVHDAQCDDCAQEVFWVAARRLRDIQAGRERAFLYGVALRVASQEVRKCRARVDRVSLDPLLQARLEFIDGSPSPEERLHQQERRQLLDVVLDAMRQELRQVLVLFEFEGLSTAAIAELQGVPVGTAASRLRRAREEFDGIARRLRARLGCAGGRHEAG